MRREFIINGNDFNDLEGFYCIIDKLLTKDLTFKTGHNLDAFNDLLRGGFGVHEYGEPILIKWINFNKSIRDLGYDETKKHYERMLKMCHPSNVIQVHNYLDAAKQHIGPTLIDIIIEIIQDTEDSGHDCELIVID